MNFANYKTHKLLGCIYNYYNAKYQESGRGVEFDKSISVIELQKLSNFKISQIETICDNLLSYKFIECKNEDVDGKNHRYSILSEGNKAYLDRFFLHKLDNFYRGWLPIVISLIATVLSVGIYVNNNTNRKELQITKQQVQHIQESLDSVKYELKLQQQK